MEIKLKKTDDQVELIKAMASKDRDTAYEAKAAVAELVEPIISSVINNAPTVSNFYELMPFDENENPSIPLDLFYDITDEDFIRVHSQSVAGGLSTNELYPSHDELKFKTYNLDSAWSFNKRYAQKARLDVVSRIFTRMAQEFLLKQETSSMNQLCGALLAATTKKDGVAAAGNHIITANEANRLRMGDFNRLSTLSKRLRTSFSSGTPTSGIKVGVTDLMMSPEMVEEMRSMAYQPVNTLQASGGTTSIPATDSMRDSILNSAGNQSLFDISIIEFLEFGINQKYNKLFSAINEKLGDIVDFTQADDEILIGLDRSVSMAMVRPVTIGEGSSSEVNVSVDDQFVDRSKKIGYYGDLEEARLILDDRVLTGIIV